MPAIISQASAHSMVFSKSLARRRLRPGQAKVLSTTHRRGNRAKGKENVTTYHRDKKPGRPSMLMCINRRYRSDQSSCAARGSSRVCTRTAPKILTASFQPVWET